jgi:transposase
MPARGPLAIAERDRAVLRCWAAAPGRRAQRAAIVLLAGQGLPNGEIARRLGVSRPAVITWRARYAADGLPGLADRPRSGRPPQARVAAIVACTLRVAPRSRSATSCARWVAAELGVSVVTVGRAWRLAHVTIAASGAVVLESDPPLPVTACEVAGLCVHGRSAIALLRRVPAAGPQAPPARVRPGGPADAGGGPPDCPPAEVAAMRRLLTAGGSAAGLHGLVAGNVLGGWARLGAGTSGLAWHLAPSDEAWLAVVEAVMCAGAAPSDPVTRAARQITREVRERLAAPGEPAGAGAPGGAAGWAAWAAAPATARCPAGAGDCQ